MCVGGCLCALDRHGSLGLWPFVRMCVSVCSKLALCERSKVGVSQRMILGNLSHVSAAPR